MWKKNRPGRLPDGPYHVIDVHAQVENRNPISPPEPPQTEQAAQKPEDPPRIHKPATSTTGRSRHRHDPNLSFPEQIERLNERLAEIEQRRTEEADELRQFRQDKKDYEQRVQKLDEREDAMFREIDAIRAKARRRERHQMEKAAHSVRVRAIKALGAMVGQAEKQAKLGKPALLRLILRSTR